MCNDPLKKKLCQEKTTRNIFMRMNHSRKDCNRLKLSHKWEVEIRRKSFIDLQKPSGMFCRKFFYTKYENATLFWRNRLKHQPMDRHYGITLLKIWTTEIMTHLPEWCHWKKNEKWKKQYGEKKCNNFNAFVVQDWNQLQSLLPQRFRDG